MALQKDANLQQSKGKFQQVLFSQNPDGENDNKSSSYDTGQQLSGPLS